MTDQEIEAAVVGATSVITHYGHWPSFHDADLVKIAVNMAGPTVTIEFRLYDWDQSVGTAKRPRLVMAWRGVENVALSGIDELGQNVVGSLELSRCLGKDGVCLETLILPTGMGTEITIRAESIQVVYFETDEQWEYENIDSWGAVTPEVAAASPIG